MAEYIEREKALKLVKALGDPHFELKHDGWNSAIFEAVEGLTALPAADVRPVVHGHWDIGYFHDRVCSCCLHPDNDLNDYAHDFCPNCDAKMDGGKNNETD